MPYILTAKMAYASVPQGAVNVYLKVLARLPQDRDRYRIDKNHRPSTESLTAAALQIVVNFILLRRVSGFCRISIDTEPVG